jgi:predicted nucleic acid-binding protein
MIVVTDTSLLNYLILVEEIDNLTKVYGKVVSSV